jgi:hypothetical protein
MPYFIKNSLALLVCVSACFCLTVLAQKKKPGPAATRVKTVTNPDPNQAPPTPVVLTPQASPTPDATVKKPTTEGPRPTSIKPAKGVVIDERLAVLRTEPSLYASQLIRMSRGRKLEIIGSKEADGVAFYKVVVPPEPIKEGWVQQEAVATTVKREDDKRLASLIQASEGFEQVERAAVFVDLFKDSPLRPAILLFFGDLIEEAAAKLSLDAGKKLDKREMAASGAPAFSFYLNYAGLDRFRKLNVTFFFNENTKQFHYDGTVWKEIMERFPKSNEAPEAKKRLDELKVKLEKVEGAQK